MLRSRIIPCLLIHQGGLVKTRAFKNPKYVGDPINAVKIFSEKEADEIIVLDIDATVNGCEPNFSLIAKLASECRMPLCYGGGVTSVDQVTRLVNIGVEKVAVSSAAINNPDLITKMALAVGQQSVVAVLDVRKKLGKLEKGFEICTRNATVAYKYDPFALALQLQNAGAGEIVVNSVDCDGMMQGYDLDLAAQFRQSLDVPLTFLGGAGALKDISKLISHVGVVGAAAGSMFVFKGKLRAVLLNYPSHLQKTQICSAKV
jgi:imidazole glycerol-phosphate synthase subunit HisF